MRVSRSNNTSAWPEMPPEERGFPSLWQRHRRQAGAIGGLSDTALAVVVGTLTLVGVVGFFQTSSSSAKTNSEIANLMSLVANIRSAYYQAGSDYTGISAAQLAAAKIAPAPLVRSSAGLTSMFGSAIAVAPASSSGGAGPKDEFIVSYVLPADACVKLLTTTSSALADVVGASVNGSNLASIDMNTAATNCVPTSGSSSTLAITFR